MRGRAKDVGHQYVFGGGDCRSRIARDLGRRLQHEQSPSREHRLAARQLARLGLLVGSVDPNWTYEAIGMDCRYINANFAREVAAVNINPQKSAQYRGEVAEF